MMGKVIISNNDCNDLYLQINNLANQKIGIVNLATDLYNVDKLHYLNTVKADMIFDEVCSLYPTGVSTIIVDSIVTVRSGIIYTGLMKFVRDSAGPCLGMILFSYNNDGPYFIVRYPGMGTCNIYKLSKEKIS